jgi:hypothetical protein
MADIASGRGIAHQAHSATTLQAFVGVTPSLFRRLSLEFMAP